MTKMGAIMAQGIVDAGGRNVTIGLRARSGFPRMTAVVSMIVFTQYWYWSPLSYFVSLTFVPTAFIGLDAKLKMPHCSVTSHCKPSLFAYPPAVTADDKKDKGKVVKAVLSTTAKAKAKAAKKARETRRGGWRRRRNGDGRREGWRREGRDGRDGRRRRRREEERRRRQRHGRREKRAGADQGGAREPREGHPGQERYVKFDDDSRFVPIVSGKAAQTRGFVVLKDTTPGRGGGVRHARRTTPAPAGPAPVTRAARRSRPRPRRTLPRRTRSSLTPTTCEDS